MNKLPLHTRTQILSMLVEGSSMRSISRKAGVMGVVVTGGEVRPGDSIRAVMPSPPYIPLAPV
ncbi:MAG: hypothetical protein ACSLFL_06040 [Alphaproteobacteria bacterium]